MRPNTPNFERPTHLCMQSCKALFTEHVDVILVYVPTLILDIPRIDKTLLGFTLDMDGLR